ncbi:GTP-binding protein [Pseudomaricurvus alkylphenolicus]|jgi:G3E family GTPase|uniref:CobW family GTP-binding protein n=1 Tax=Pseudomaricurvus alkylphenolicus TaxID=1306991 RepID=UPI00141DD181|nr:GTP-binding protein [Pseudomaricurvus alkylphenolicus]NIB43051.1 GTP-binding protein [Pseudomaricurvus alkylphenolicus]
MISILNSIPTNIITGFLGAGKTTAIRHLLKTKPNDEKWAVLVNEFGEVGIDGALLSADGIAVKEVPGGCMCCAVGLPSKAALNELIQTHHPDRILIEPTGLAHPQQVVKQFSGPEYQSLLDMQAVICLIDPWSLSQEKFLELPAFHSQIELADILIATKADMATEEQLARFESFCQQLQPAKAHTGVVSHGQLDWRWLSRPHNGVQPSGQPTKRSHAHTGVVQSPEPDQSPVSKLERRENQAEFGYSCGWLMPEHYVFDHQALISLLECLPVPRIKGVLRTQNGWHIVNRMRATVSVERLENGRDSDARLEMIHTEPCHWEQIEAQLLQVLQTA